MLESVMRNSIAHTDRVRVSTAARDSSSSSISVLRGGGVYAQRKTNELGQRQRSLPKVMIALQPQTPVQGIGLPRRKVSPGLMKTLGTPGSRGISPLYPRPEPEPSKLTSKHHRQDFQATLQQSQRLRQQYSSAVAKEKLAFSHRLLRCKNDPESTALLISKLIESCYIGEEADYVIAGRRVISTPETTQRRRLADLSPLSRRLNVK